MPGKLMDKFTVFDMNQSYMFAGFAIFGLLKGQIPPEEGERLLKKIATAAQIAECSNVKECEGLLGSKYHDLMVDVVNVEDVTQIVNANEKDTRGYQPNFYVKFTDDRWEGPIQDSVDGLKELSALMEEKLPNIKFPTESSKNYAYAIKDFIDKVAYGDGVTKAIDENAGYQYMFNLFAKLDMTGATFTDQNKVTLNEDGSRNIQKMDGLWLNVREKDDMRIMAAYDNSGILDAMAGGVRITNKTKDHLTTGDVSRDELLDEYRLQYQRMQKALSLSKEEYDKIAAAGGVANDYEEFTWGPRGYGKILKDVENRIRFMDAGFPVSDLADLCVMDEYVNSLERIHKDRVSSYEYENRSIAEAREKINKSEPKNEIEKAEKEKKLKDLDAREEKQKARKEENDINAQSIDQLKKDWNKVFEGKGLTQEERIGKLENFSASIKAAKNNIKNMGDKNLEVLSTRLEARKNAVLSEGEKSLMASTPEEMLANLNSVDPKLMVSSKEFRKMKTELANLNRAKQAIEKAETLIDKKDAEAEYRKQAEKTYKATRNYLRYKTRQMNGPKRGHKRSLRRGC